MPQPEDHDAAPRRVLALLLAVGLGLVLVGLLATRLGSRAPGEGEVSSIWLVFILGLGAAVIALSALLARDLWLQGWLGRLFRRRSRRRDLGPFPEAWEQILRQNVPAYRHLSPERQQRLRLEVQAFVTDKRFEGCAGQAITDEVRVTIAGQACRMLLGWDDHDGFSHVEAILVYPTEFALPAEDEEEEGTGPVTGLLGQAVYRGPVILSWDSVLDSGQGGETPFNVVLHEFAHQLDFAGQDLADLARPGAEARLRRFRAVLDREYRALVNATEAGEETLLDPYGATEPIELFAVATECFFELPRAMAERHPDLYEVLCEVYHQRPADPA